MKFNKNTLIIILIILSIGFIICQLITTSSTENFIVLLEEKIIPKSCADYLYYDGKKFYLYRSRKLIDKTNPMIFDSLQKVKDYWETTGNHCLRLPVTNLAVKKTNLDPTVEYKRECYKKSAMPNYRIDNCYDYAKTIDKKKKYLSILDDEKYQGIFDTDTCITNIINKESPDMNKKQEVEFRNELFKFY